MSPAPETSARSAGPALLNAIVDAVTGYEDGHLLGIQSCRDTNWVLWHADAASASAQITSLIKEAARPCGAASLAAIVDAVTGYRDRHLEGVRSCRDLKSVLWHADAASASAEIIGLINDAASPAGQRQLAVAAA